MASAAILTQRPLALAAGATLTSPKVSIGALTSGITLSLRRPTTAAPLAWAPDAKLRVSIVLVLDGVEQRTVGQTSGGIRLAGAVEMPEYRLTFEPTVLLGEKAKAFIATATPDAQGFYSGVPLTRIGETAVNFQAYLIFEAIGGPVQTEVTIAATDEAPAPTVRTKNSVAFDAATSISEIAGDGVVSLTHTSTGANLGVFAGVACDQTPHPTPTGTTYDGVSMAEQWNLNPFNILNHAGYTLNGQASGAKTVTSTLDSAPGDHSLGVISMTGVDQATPVGTAATGSGTSDPATVTVASVGADDMVVDNLVSAFASTPTAGADQTQRYSESTNFFGYEMRGSTQPGSLGGVMSWTFGSAQSWGLGAIAFKAAGSIPGANAPTLRMRARSHRPGVQRDLKSRLNIKTWF